MDELQRVVYVGPEARNKNLRQGFYGNKVRTSKYTIFTFIPHNLYEQFKRISNVYFLIISILALIPGVSPTNPITSILPLVFVLTVTAVKEAYEDLKRHQADRRVNARKALVFRNDAFKEIKWMDLEVGDILKISADEEVPADFVLLATSDEEGIALIETANLDGETNLKQRQALEQTAYIKSEEDLIEFLKTDATIEVEPPSTDLLKFRGKFSIDGEDHPLTMKQLILRGCELKNIEWSYGVAVYTGRDTKLRRNAEKPHYKMSSFEKQMNYVMLILFIVYVATVSVSIILQQVLKPNSHWYLDLQNFTGVFFLKGLGTFIVLYAQLIPISLFVSMDLVKLVLSYFIWEDLELYDEESRSRAVAHNFSLVEELGRIKYIFADKTGTLTINKMKFAKCTVRGEVFEDRFDSKEAAEFWNFVAVCHTVIPEKKNGDTKYRATSEDERALVVAAREHGFNFYERKRDIMFLKVGEKSVKYEILQTLEFDSDRKRMSIVLRDGSSRITMYTKGADNVMLEILKPGQEQLSEKITQQIKTFATEGFRTLVMAKKELSEEHFTSWNEKFKEAQAEIEGREEKMGKLMEELETDLELVAASAIEDKLQDRVPETMENISKAGIKIWVLTGDKVETAVNVGYSCRLLTDRMQKFKINATEESDVERQLEDALSHMQGHPDAEYGFVVDGKALGICLQSFPERLYQIAQQSKAVIIARISPLQKAKVVHLVKTHEKGARILAIGDGANDVSMIQDADVGVGISGKEGRQAVMASDYAIAQFRYLQRLLFFHGRYGYKRLTKLVLYSFYKNILFIMVQFWFIFYSKASGQTIYESWAIAMFNTLFAFLPIMFLAIFDQDVAPSSVVRHPQLYNAGIVNSEFTKKRFVGWAFEGLWGSVVVFFGVSYTFLYGAVHPKGLVVDLWSAGTTMYTAVLITVTLKVLLETNYVTVWNAVSMIASIIAWFLFVMLFYLIPGGDFIVDNSNMYGVAFMIFQLPVFWALLLVIPVICLLPAFTYKYWRRTYNPASFHIIHESEKFEPQSEKSPLLESRGCLRSPRQFIHVEISAI